MKKRWLGHELFDLCGDLNLTDARSTCVIHRDIPREVDKFSEIASICSVSASNMIDTCY